jgi:beta-aspartyl-peptidase (threonine type)
MMAASVWAQQPTVHRWAIVLHGGAGTIERASMTPAREAAYRASLAQATEAGAQVLDRGGSSLDAVEAAIRIL